jgi:mannose-6-phosphate isomerase-like protein (cupin superfamily)
MMHIDDENEKVKPGDTIYIPPKAMQFISNIGNSDLIFICIVDPAWKVEDEIIHP